MRCGKPHDFTHLRGRIAWHLSCAARRANRPDTFEIERKESENSRKCRFARPASGLLALCR
ncbi:hypothetical protein BCEP4_670023 [Burkholderia cepacia]|nr:hypothetical protein BCEP4_670023 [Burkholderia cepacia]